jgi:hypothetical protein
MCPSGSASPTLQVDTCGKKYARNWTILGRLKDGTLFFFYNLIGQFDRGVSIDVAFKYSHADNPNRPSKFYYRIGLFVEDKLVEDIFGKFNNTEQVDLSLTSCSGTGVNTLYYVYGTERDVEKFVARQSCNVEEKYRSLFILPQ